MVPYRMSFIKRDEDFEEKFNKKSSESENNEQNDDERISEESDSESVTRLKKNPARKNVKTFSQTSKHHFGRCTSILRQRHYSRKNKHPKSIKKKMVKKNPEKLSTSLGNTVEIAKKGKRCRIEGKAKGKPPEEENQDKCDSDDDDSSYFSRISLGYFQKYKDKSGASTSYQVDEYSKNSNHGLETTHKLKGEISEEMELLELQKWGMAGSLTFCQRNIDKLSTAENTGGL